MTDNCSNPSNSPIVSYNKGCRCSRCFSAKQEQYEKHKERRLAKQRTYYQTHKKEIVVKNSKRISNEILTYKLQLKCEDCGYDKIPNLLQFHHPDGATSRNWRQGMIDHKKGLAVALCPTCHASRHYDPTSGKVRWNVPSP
jgi:hypothetical protein